MHLVGTVHAARPEPDLSWRRSPLGLRREGARLSGWHTASPALNRGLPARRAGRGRRGTRGPRRGGLPRWLVPDLGDELLLERRRLGPGGLSLCAFRLGRGV